MSPPSTPLKQRASLPCNVHVPLKNPDESWSQPEDMLHVSVRTVVLRLRGLLGVHSIAPRLRYALVVKTVVLRLSNLVDVKTVVLRLRYLTLEGDR